MTTLRISVLSVISMSAFEDVRSLATYPIVASMTCARFWPTPVRKEEGQSMNTDWPFPASELDDSVPIRSRVPEPEKATCVWFRRRVIFNAISDRNTVSRHDRLLPLTRAAKLGERDTAVKRSRFAVRQGYYTP